ncbi:HAMP domain-containing protein [Paenibacillus sp. cl6col]|uniref:methyl-accepting chemotaxis protein n=2 Tax=unclassified Paenibacillus TaxID=185978 RepID=UPI00088E3280|nr:HAMP domain-containing methyl-accepting chemotaxis protein [Paenibacillus sp. cl6col]SDG32208.1 HAMP domain-containing protein [Paenibacillus sp. cl6col]
MLEKLLSPFTSILSRLKYGQKFMLISVLFIIPIIVLLYEWNATQQTQINFIRGEQAGVEQISEIMPFMLQVQQQRGLINGYLNGNKEAKSTIEAKLQEIAQLIEHIEAKFRKENLPQSYEKWASIHREWIELRDSYESLKASDSFVRHSKLVEQIEELIVNSADESELSLDNEINSYYLMRLVVQELPALIENSAFIRGTGNGILASRTLTDELKIQLLLREYESKTALVSLNKSLSKIAESQSNINVNLVEKGGQVAHNIQNYLVLLEQEIIHKQEMSMNPDTFFTQGTVAITTADEVFKLAIMELDHILQERIDDYTAERNVTLVIMVVVLLLVVIFYVAFFRSVMDTVSILKQRAESMAKGDFSQDIVLNTKDELQLVGAAFNEMQRSMNRVLSLNQQISLTTFQSSQQLTGISDQSIQDMKKVADSVQKVSDGTASQKRTTVEASSAMNEMAIGITRVAEAASEVASVAIRASENAVIGNQQLIETMDQMESIKKTQADSAQIVAKLDEHSVRISQIIKSIMEIAKQTKLLALNANIEAARAGEHGRGFSVVAQEIGELAEETSSSGKSISDLLIDIRSLVGATVSAMDSIQIETNMGMESIERTKETIDCILSEVKLVSEQIQDVSATTEEMSAGMEEVAASIADVSDISHRTSNEAELMATGTAEQLVSAEKIQISAKELRDMSQQLQNDLSKFVLCNDVIIPNLR